MLPSKNYIVLPFYNYTATEDPLLYAIEYSESDSSCAVEYLKPDTLYSFQVIALDSNSTKSSWIVSSLRTIVIKNDTFRLIGGQLPNEGIVEVFKSGFWHRICHSHSWRWSHNESKVVCRSLGLQNPRLYYARGTFFFSAHLQYLAGFRCSGTETSLDDCHHINDSRATSSCNEFHLYHYYYPGYFLCGSPPVSQHNVTQMAGTITSPGYPNYMIQTDSRWIFSHNITRGRVLLYFDELDLRRRYRGTSSVHVKELTSSFSKWYKTHYHGSRFGMLLTLPAQITFYSSLTSTLVGGNYGKGILFHYIVYSEHEVTTLKNWTIELSSPIHSIITATWDRMNFADYDILIFWMNCNSTQEWAKEIPYVIGGSSITTLSCRELIGYTHYKVHVLVQLRKRGDGSFFTYRSLYASITTKESSPKTSPPGLHATNIEENKATITWQPIPRNNTHGVLLGYIVNVNSYSSSSNVKVVTNGTSIVITNLVPAAGYYARVEGYTSVGSGPRGYTYFETRCGRSIKNQLHGKIHLSNVYTSVDCVWRLNTPTANTLVLLVLETLEIPLSFDCKSFYIAITDGLGNQLTKLCGSKRSLSFVSIGSTEIKVHLQRATSGTPIMTASFVMLVNGIGTIPYSIQPWNVSSTTQSSTSVNVSWEKYPGKQYVSKYIAICTANNRHGNISAAYIDSLKYNIMVQNLLKYTEYKVAVVAIFGNSSFNSTNINETMVKSQEVLFKTSEDVPSRPPRDVTATYLESNTLVVNWKEVDNEFTNGIVIGYYVYYQVAWSGSSWNKEYITSDKTKARLKNLKEVTQYRIEVSAATKIGEGPKSRRIFIKTGCQKTLSAEYGTFTSPNYPNNYPSNVKCTWTITSLNSATEVVVIFEKFDIEKGITDNCNHDFVEVLAMSRNIIAKAVCGQKRPFAIVSVHRLSLKIVLQSDGGLERTGFKAIYFPLLKNDKVILPQVSTITSKTASLSWKRSASINWFYILYKRDKVDEIWKVVNTTALDITIDGLLPSTKYLVKVIGNGSTTVYWSNTMTFVTNHLFTTPRPEEMSTSKPTGSLQRMYSYGLSEGDIAIPNTWEYLTRCFKLSFSEDGFLFFTKRHYNIYICHNGVMQFESSSYLHWPTTFKKHSVYCYHDILAPYWSLTDKNHGKVFYHVYTLKDNTEKSRNVLDQATFDVLQLQQQPSFPESFRASWVLVVTWDKLRHSTYNEDTRHLTNTFQAVLIADEVRSFAMFNYPKDGIQWSAPTSRQNWHFWNTGNDRSLPVVGWNAAGLCKTKLQHFFSVEKSGTVSIGDIDITKGQSVYPSQNRRNISREGNGIQGKWFFELYLPWAISRGEIKCKEWFKKQPDPRRFLEYLEPCPCTSRHGWFDERFTPLPAGRGQSTGWWIWWSSLRPCVISTFPSIDGWKQKCCYSHEPGQWGALLVGHPNAGYSQRDANDLSGYQHCCINSKFCHLFYQRRPSDDCKKYQPPEWSWMWGDPHFVTLDGKNYTFNGLGEYVMLDARDGFFQLQSRTRLAKGKGTATIFCAAVMKERNCSTVQLNLAENGTMLLVIDGDIMSFESIGNESKRLNGSVVVARPQENSFKATYPSGISVTLTESKGALSILVALPKSFKNQTRGLLGTWNDNKVDDFTTPSGYALPYNATGRTIHFDFGQKWQVNETTSLFTYSANESVSSFSNTSFVPMFVDELKFANKSLEKQALAECNSDINCLFDAASTNDISVGLDTKVVGSQMVNDSVILSNSPPKFSNESSVVILKVNATKHLSITVEDKDGDSVNVNVSRSPKGAIVKSNSSRVSVSWLVSMEKISQEFIATDSKGAVAILRPSYYLCACHNGATCIESKDDIERQGDDRFQILPCHCKSGYTGKYCENDIDACSVNLNPCYPGVKCKDLPAPANESGYECGSCPSGFSGKGDSCQDIDECRRSSHGCSQLCFNTPGSFVCDCEKGYTLESDGSSCKDINECEPSSDCMQICVNTPGSYNCSCNEDFKVDPLDSKKCIPRSPCNESNSCQQICYESNDIAKCACYMGYQLQADNASCADIDECGTQKDRCNQICHNKEGGYNCTCLKGFRLSSDNVTCVDINECIEWTFADCSAPLRCKNTIGSYNCSCEDGLNWIDGDCREPLKEEKKPSTSSPPTKPITDSPEDISNAVRVTIKDLNISEWDQQFDLKFKKSVARQVTAFCAKNDICLRPKGRERRSNGAIFFSSNEVIILQDYPKQLANINAVVAFYVKAPTAVNLQHAVSIDGAILSSIINGSLENIGNDIGKTLLSVSRYQTVADPTTTQSPETTAAGYVPKDDNKLFYIIGGSVGGAIALFVLLALIARCCKRQPQKVEPEKVDVELKPYPPRSFVYENPNAVSDI